MLLKKTASCIIFIILSSSRAFAISCDNPINNYDHTYCASSEMIQLDQNLNEQYRKTINSLSEERKKQLKMHKSNGFAIVTMIVHLAAR